MSGNSCCFDFGKIFFPRITAFQQKELSLFSDILFLFQNGYHGNNKNITDVFQMSKTIHPSKFRFIFGLQTEIFLIVYCLILQLSLVTSQNLLSFSFCKTSEKTTFLAFQSFFLGKLSKSRSLKLSISRTARWILTILVSFCRISNSLLDEIHLFWCCSSPLRKTLILQGSGMRCLSQHCSKTKVPGRDWIIIEGYLLL